MSFKIKMKDGESQTLIVNNEFVITVTRSDSDYLLSSLHLKKEANNVFETMVSHTNEFFLKILKLVRKQP